MSKRNSNRARRALFDNGRPGTKALRKRRLLFEPLEIRTTVSDSLLGLLSAGAILPDAAATAESETEIVSGVAKKKDVSETDSLLAEFIEGDPAGAILSQTQGGASSAAASGPIATESTSDSESSLAPREHGLIEPLVLAAPGEESLLSELDLAAMALLGGSGNAPPIPYADSGSVVFGRALNAPSTAMNRLLFNDIDYNNDSISFSRFVTRGCHC